MKLYGKYLLILFKSQMQYRTSFLLLSLASFLFPLPSLRVFTYYLNVLVKSKAGNFSKWPFALL